MQVQEKEDTYKQTRIDALFGAARVRWRNRLLPAGMCLVLPATLLGRHPLGAIHSHLLAACKSVGSADRRRLLRTAAPTLQSKQRPHLALEGGEQQQQQQHHRIGDLEDFGAGPAARATAGAGPVGIATSVEPEAAAGAREGENAADAANQGDEEMPDRWRGRTVQGWAARG